MCVAAFCFKASSVIGRGWTRRSSRGNGRSTSTAAKRAFAHSIPLFRRISATSAANSPRKLSDDAVLLTLQNLFSLTDFIAYNYAPEYTKHTFSKAAIPKTAAVQYKKHLTETGTPENTTETTLEELIRQNQKFADELTKRRQLRRKTYSEDPLAISEYKTRKIYIDTDLKTAGWTEGQDWLNEVELDGMPNKAKKGFADYVLFGNDGIPLAVIEAKKTSVGIEKGKQQAKLYADLLQTHYRKKTGIDRRPIIFLTNGFDTQIWEDLHYPPRKVASIYSKRDLEKEHHKLEERRSLIDIQINPELAGRPYQIEAVKAVCESFDEGNRRKALLVMATGSGKTRTVMSLIDVLLKKNWIKNVLFLADRTTLVRQAKAAFTLHMPSLTTVNLCTEKNDINARAVFSTYQTMQNEIDNLRDEKGARLFTCGHFDLIIVDEAHRSIYNKYKDIFTFQLISKNFYTLLRSPEITKSYALKSLITTNENRILFYCANTKIKKTRISVLLIRLLRS